MEILDELDLAILRAVRDGGVTEITPFWKDSGHTEGLAEKGYIDETDTGVHLSQKGLGALAQDTDDRG